MYYEYTGATKQVLTFVKTVITSTILQYFILHEKSKHDYYNNNIRLLMTFEYLSSKSFEHICHEENT